MLDALHLGQHLLGRAGDQVLDLHRRGAGDRDEDIGEGHVDLRLFLPRRHQDGEEPQQQPHQGQQRGDGGVLEARRDPPGDARIVSAISLRSPARWDLSSTPAAMGSRATRSPSVSPDRTAQASPRARPRRIWRKLDPAVRQDIDPGDLGAVDHRGLGDRQFAASPR